MKSFFDTIPIVPSRRVPRKKDPYPFLPYDPNLVSDLDKRLEIPRDWRVLLSLSPNGRSEPPQDLLNLIDKLSSNLPTDKEMNSRVTTDEDRVRHLLARTSFAASVTEIQSLQATPISDLVEVLLADKEMPAPPGEWVSEPFDILAFRRLSEQEQMEFFIKNNERINQFRGWWIEQMMRSEINLRERMTFFWHGHFTSDLEAGVLAQFLFKQIDTLRKHALGNFRDFLTDIYKDPTMLLYLDGAINIGEQPNENFARELLELFTMGVGNYTEQDIKEAARAFTGWQVDTYNITSFFNPNLHDNGIKTFLGRTGNFQGDDIIDIILQQDQTARHIARKVYEHFVSREVDEAIIEGIAATFRSNDYEIKPMLRQLFTDDLFYSERAVASLIKAPIEMAVQNARVLSVQNVDLYFVLFTTAILDQELLNPPNVAGWPGQRNWISPATYVTRNTVNEVYVNPEIFRNEDGSPFVEFEPLEFARSFGIADAQGLAEAMIRHLLQISVSQETFDFLLTALLGSADPGDWSLDYPGADRFVRSFLVQVLRLPEYHLT